MLIIFFKINGIKKVTKQLMYRKLKITILVKFEKSFACLYLD